MARRGYSNNADVLTQVGTCADERCVIGVKARRAVIQIPSLGFFCR
jgi:hypothetical protein